MTPRRTLARWCLYGLAALLIVPAAALVTASSVPAPAVAVGVAPTAASVAPGAALPGSAALLERAQTLIADHAVPKTDVFLPNFNTRPTVGGGVVHPLYSTAPAPMGLGYFGIDEQHGHDVGTISYTNSVEASASISSVDPFYLPSTSPDWFTMQLNTVMTHTDVLGNLSGTYWIQNVPIYQASTQTLSFEDNIWNFTAPGAAMQIGTMANYSGYLFPGVFYYAPGPSFYMPEPFTVRLYNNITTFNNLPTVWFNYSVTAANGSIFSGSYDRVEFNAFGGPSATPAPAATFQINGKSYNAFGLFNDAEIMLGGPGGGSTTTLLGINATMGLWLKSNTTGAYAPVPAAYDFGTDTGETSEGIAEWATGGPHPLAVLGSGPSLLEPLWGLVGAHAGFLKASFKVTPSNAFVFASKGSGFDPDTAAWAPVPTSGIATYRLPPGNYAFRFLLSDHTPATVKVARNLATAVTLPVNNRMGVYTPLWATGNAQLAAISSSGSGTPGHPYVLDHNGVGPVNPLFGEFNDYYYPVFPGILLANTTDRVTVTGTTDFPVSYSLPFEAGFSSRFGTPYSNNLALEFYGTTNVSLYGNSQLTGWGFVDDGYLNSVMFWNCQDSLIAANTFEVDGIGLVLAGGSHNTVWGNTFVPSTVTAANPATILDANYQEALQVYESGDLIYNNAFTTFITAYTPGFNLYSGAPSVWTDTWNVAPQPATNHRFVNGFNLTGSILGLSTVSGNYWGNYGNAGNPYGVLPYDDYGAITVGGDTHPLEPFTLYKVVFNETGLPSGTVWSVTLNGITAYGNTAAGSRIALWDPNGTYAYTVGTVSGYTAHPPYGAALVAGHAVYKKIVWT